MPERKPKLTAANSVEVTTTEEVRVKATIWSRIWSHTLAKEALLMVVSVAAVQLAFGFNELSGIVETSESWKDLFTGFKGWAAAFSFALVQNVVKQSLAWFGARLAGTKL